jgi:hypothetical protein
MDADTLRGHVRRIRAERRTRKEKTVDRKARTTRSDNARQRATSLISGLTQAEKERLLKELEE